MGKLGNWIDGLTDEQKDRIVRGQKWRVHLRLDSRGRKCLIGHAAGYRAEGFDNGGVLAGRKDTSLQVGDTGRRFDALCVRFGLERIVRACKQRAAATMSGEVERPEREAVPAHASTQEV